MDRAPYRYKRFISDIGGQDIKSHNKSPARAVRCVRDWLQSAPGKTAIPGGAMIWRKYRRFRQELPVIAEEAELDPGQLTFIDYLQLVINWLKEHRGRSVPIARSIVNRSRHAAALAEEATIRE